MTDRELIHELMKDIIDLKDKISSLESEKRAISEQNLRYINSLREVVGAVIEYGVV